MHWSLASVGFGTAKLGVWPWFAFLQTIFYRCRVCKDWCRCVGGGELGHGMTRVGDVCRLKLIASSTVRQSISVQVHK